MSFEACENSGMPSALRILSLAVCYAVPGVALAQAPTGAAYPAKSIRFVVGFPPSGTNDFLARAVAPKIAEFLGQQVIIDNRGGASTMIATELASRAAADGYTILLNAPELCTAFIQNEMAKWAKVIRAAGIKAQ